jgi:hypothetical protein
MKILGTLCTLALFLFLIAPIPGYSQDRDENKPNLQDEQKPKDNKGKQEDKARPDEGKRNDNPNLGRQDDRKQPEATRPQEQPQREQQQRDQDRNQDRNKEREQHPVEQQRPMDNDHRAAQDNDRERNEHAGNRGRRIPDDQFRSHFGREHHFHVQRERIVNVSQPVVVYSGYSWQLAEPWPSDWSYDDDCYIDEVDGEYFLFDTLHPGIRIAVFIVD